MATLPPNFADRDGFIWLDGALIPWRDAKIHVLTHTLHYGMGVFEGVRAYKMDNGQTAIFRLAEHTKRLFNSAKVLGMPMPFTHEQLNDAQRLVVRENNLPECYLRPMCFYGSEAMGLHAKGLQTHVMIAAWPFPAYLGEEGKERGIRVKTSSFTRHHVNSAMCRAKASGHYFNSMLAISEVARDGYDEALMLDHSGFVAEGSAENIFVIRDGVISTPDLTSALDGITRATIMQIAQDLGYTVRERRITRDEIYVADEAFFTGTAAEVVPIRELDNRTIGNGSRGPLTEKLQTLYLRSVRGQEAPYAHWCTPV